MLFSPPKTRATPCRIHLLPLFKKLLFRNVRMCKVFCAVLQSTLRSYGVDFVVRTKAVFTHLRTRSLC